jgi:hypothetical protein
VEKQIVKPMSAFRASNLLLKGAKGGTKPTWAIIEKPGQWQRGASNEVCLTFSIVIFFQKVSEASQKTSILHGIQVAKVANCIVDIFGRPIHRGAFQGCVKQILEKSYWFLSTDSSQRSGHRVKVDR